MNEYLIPVIAILLATATMLTANPASAVAHPYEFHADARMRHDGFGSVAKTYGYLNILTNSKGHGIINVMFSNGSDLQPAKFNARIKFLSSNGVVIGEEKFDCWIAAAGSSGATECKVSRALNRAGFDAVEVDFFLSDFSELSSAAVID